MMSLPFFLFALISLTGTLGCIMPESGKQYRIMIAGGVTPYDNRFNRFLLSVVGDTDDWVALTNTDDESGRQRWILNKISEDSGSEYWHIASVGANAKLLGIYGNNINVVMADSDSGTGQERWRITSNAQNGNQWCQIERISDGGRQYMCVPQSGQYVRTCIEGDGSPRRWFFQSLDF